MKEKLPKTIGLMGAYGVPNLGDEAVLEVILGWLKLKFPDSQIIVFSYDPLYTKRIMGVNAVKLLSDRKELDSIYKRLDYLLLGGGGLIYDYGGLGTPIPWFKRIWLAHIRKIPLISVGLGVGPLSSKLAQFLTGLLFRKFRLITVRDHESERLLINCRIPKNKVFVMGDPALILPSKKLRRGIEDLIYKRDNLSWENNTKKICISIRPWFKKVDPCRGEEKEALFIKVLATLIKQILDNNIADEVILLPMQHKHTDSDIQLIFPLERELSLHYRGQIKRLGPVYSPQEIKAILSEVNLLIGMRLHSLILAASAYTPVIGISYDPKVKAFLEMIGLSEYAIQLDEIIDNAGIILHKINEILTHRKDIVATLKSKVKLLQIQVNEGFSLIEKSIKY